MTDTAWPEGQVWVVVPTYQEAGNIERLIAAVLGALDGAGLDGRMLVVDDGSPDGTADLVRAVEARDGRVELIERATKEGIGPAYIAGFRHAIGSGADLIVQMDADFSHDPADVPRLVAAARSADVVVGSRYVPGGRIVHWNWFRRFISRAGTVYAKVILGVGLNDLTAGFKCFRREVLEEIELDEVSSAGYVFQIEMTYRARLAGFRVVEIPITFTERTVGASKMSGGIVGEAAGRVLRLRRLRSARQVTRR